jgi:hypothetical protein
MPRPQTLPVEEGSGQGHRIIHFSSLRVSQAGFRRISTLPFCGKSESFQALEGAACYRLYAANCVELAERISDTSRRIFLLRVAQSWSRLAERWRKPKGPR